MLDRSTNLFATDAAPAPAPVAPVIGDDAPLFGHASATLLVEPAVAHEQPTDEVPAVAPAFATTVSAEQAEPAQKDGSEPADVERPVRTRTPRRRATPRSKAKRAPKRRGRRGRSSGLATGSFGRWIKVAGGSFVGFLVLLVVLALTAGSHGKRTTHQKASAKPAARATRAPARGKQHRQPTPESVGGQLRPAHEGERRSSGGTRTAATPRVEDRARRRRARPRAAATPSTPRSSRESTSSSSPVAALTVTTPTRTPTPVPSTPRRSRSGRTPAGAPAQRDAAEFGIEG